MINLDFSDQVILVTGATRGIGKQIADDFEKLGAFVIGTGTRKEEIEQLNASGPASREYKCVDFSDNEATKQFTDYLRTLDKLDVCVNNAGTNRPEFIEDTGLNDWEDIQNINLGAPFRIMRAVTPVMKKNNYGRIVNITSLWAHISMVKRSVYTASKFGLRGLTLSLGNELAPYNILVNAVSPGFILTDLSKQTLSDEERKRISEKIPVGRFGETEEISRLVLFLASSLNTYIVGQSIVADGGYMNL